MRYDLFYQNRRLLVLLILLVVVGGVSSYAVLPRAEDPALVPRAQNILTPFPGRSAEEVETQVTEVIEDQISEIEEVKEYRSVSRAGVSFVAVELRDEVSDPEKVWSRLRDKVADIEAELPDGALKPQFDELDFKANAMIVALKWTHDSETNYSILRRTAEELKDQIMAITGTEKVDLFGDPKEEITVELDAAKLASLGLTAAEVSQTIFESDSKSNAGLLRGTKSDLLIGVTGELESVRDVANVPIRLSEDGAFIQLGDVAKIEKRFRDPVQSIAIVDGKDSVVLGMLVRDNYRIDYWADRVESHLAKFEKTLTDGIEIKTIFEQNSYVQNRLINLGINLLFGGLAVIVVIFFMMGWRNALIVASSLPFTALTVLTGLNFLGIPIHQMSVTGLIIALGLLIDNAIVIVDEVSARMKEGDDASTAITECVKKLAIPLFGSTLTTAFAFAPIALMPGPAGEFVGSIAVSVILAIFGSLILSMTVIAAMTGIFSPFVGGRSNKELHGWWVAGASPKKLSQRYENSLRNVFSRPAIGILIGVTLPVLGFMQASKLPEQFFPSSERDQIQIELDLPNQASISHTLDSAMAIREEFIKHPRVKAVDWFLGESAPTFYYNVIPRRKNFSNYAQAVVTLDSPKDVPSLIHELQDIANQKFTGDRVLVRQLEQGPPFDAPVEVRLFGPNLDQLRMIGNDIRKVVTSTPGVIHTRCDLSETLPKLDFQIDEEKARLVGLSNGEIANQLAQMLEGATGGSIREETEELPVRVRLGNQDRSQLSSIRGVEILAKPDGETGGSSRQLLPGIPVSSLGEEKLVNEYATIVHLSGRRMNEIQTFIPAGVLPNEILIPLRKRLTESGIENSLPFGYQIKFGGEAAKRDEAVGSLFSFVGILGVLMMATLVLSFGSFRVAGIIASVAMLSVGLGMGALWLFGFPFGFMAIVGTMGLIGVAINDSIVVLAAIKEDDLARTGDPEAIRHVVMHASRHIVSTSLTTMAGFAPLILGGGGFWPPLAITIAGGVMGATILALYYVPSLYILLMGSKREVAGDA